MTDPSYHCSYFLIFGDMDNVSLILTFINSNDIVFLELGMDNWSISSKIKRIKKYERSVVVTILVDQS